MRNRISNQYQPRRQLTQDNVGTINALELPMQELFDDGKALYERSNPAKLKDYTYKQLLKRVRLAQAAKPVELGRNN